ncbi:MAG TPA: hypothetical protein VFA54_08840 [Bryobacterales bacterium]|jgi:hypothetical protein|nr:hypothetical protein [Bryobacterales bacterium]
MGNPFFRFPAALAVLLISLVIIAPYTLGRSAPSADAELARWYARNPKPWQWQTEWGGGSPVLSLGSPGLPLLTAAVASIGLPFERARLIAGGLSYAVAPVGVFYLARALALPAWWTSLAFALAPHRWLDFARQDNAAHALELALLPIILLQFARRRWLAGAGGVLAAALCIPRSWNALPELELAIALFSGLLAKHAKQMLPLAACIAIFAAGLSWEAFFQRSGAVPGTSFSVPAYMASGELGETVLGLPFPDPGWNPVRRQAEQLILSPNRPMDSILWMQALGIRRLAGPWGAKYDALLACEEAGKAGCLFYATPLRRAAQALLVSRYQWRRLPALRSLYDRAALNAYVNWSNRPEAAGWRWTRSGTAEIRASLGPDDMILVRQNADGGWTASADTGPVALFRDPIGYLVLDPGRPGPIFIQLARRTQIRSSFSHPPRRLPARIIPAIDPDGIIDGVAHTPPPVAPGSVISIFGSDLNGAGSRLGSTRVLVSGRPAEVLYAGDNQINARLPADLPSGRAEIIVETAEGRSDPATLEIQGR